MRNCIRFFVFVFLFVFTTVFAADSVAAESQYWVVNYNNLSNTPTKLLIKATWWPPNCSIAVNWQTWPPYSHYCKVIKEINSPSPRNFYCKRGFKIIFSNLIASTFAIEAVSSTDLSSLDLKFLVRYGYKRFSYHFPAAMPWSSYSLQVCPLLPSWHLVRSCGRTPSPDTSWAWSSRRSNSLARSFGRTGGRSHRRPPKAQKLPKTASWSVGPR